MLKGKRQRGSGGGRVVAMKPYPIGTAARLAGIPPETLRIWERRYKMLAPSRTEGGHRLYSERDVEVLRAVKRLVDAGMRIGSVAVMSAERILEEAAAVSREHGNEAPALEAGLLEGNERLLDEILEAARTLDTDRTAALLDRPRLLTDGLEVVTSLYLPLLHRVGEMWHRGELSVGEEHFVEKLVTARLHAILHSTPPPLGVRARSRLALCACPPGERHEGGLIAAGVALKAAGFSVVLLGADLPISDLIEAARKLAPSLVVLGVVNDLSDETRSALPRALERPPLSDIPLLVGGGAAAQLASLLKREHIVVPEVSQVVGVARRVTG